MEVVSGNPLPSVATSVEVEKEVAEEKEITKTEEKREGKGHES